MFNRRSDWSAASFLKGIHGTFGIISRLVIRNELTEYEISISD